MKTWAIAALLAILGSSSAEIYRVEPGSVIVDGLLDDRAWADAVRETAFTFPWQDRQAPATEFRALAGDDRLYFAFRVVDADIVLGDGEGEEAVTRGDRVELFFALDAALEDYLCFEIDPEARVLDYRASFYREFDFDWDLPGIEAAASRTEDGYIVEGSLPWAALPDGDGDRILTGIFRAEFSHGEGDAPEAAWISWVRPDTTEPDFHVPSAFGWLERARR